MSSARILLPIAITSAMLQAGTTLAEPASVYGEVAWVASIAYVVDDERTHNGSLWSCVRAHSGRTATPASDPIYWLRKGPTNRLAPFDDFAQTTATANGTLTYVIRPGALVTGLSLWALSGAAYSITVTDGPGGATISSASGDLYQQPLDFADLLFGLPIPLTRIALEWADLVADPVITITVTNGAGLPVRIGDIKIGTWRYLITNGAAWGGVNYGAQATPKSYSTRRTLADGTYTLTRRGSSNDLRATLTAPGEQAIYITALLAAARDIAVPIELSGLPRYGHLSTLGFISAEISDPSNAIVTVSLQIQGTV